MSAFRVVIPARYASSRLPGKPLAMLAGKPMIAHVCERARESGADDIWVAVDDERIVSVVRALGMNVLMTSPDHASGTDRIAEVARVRGWAASDIVVNLQGDEPLMPPGLLAQTAGQLASQSGAALATWATPIHSPEELWNPNVVKAVLDDAGFALYFSRAPIPWARGVYSPGAPPARLSEHLRPLRHLGLYGYRVETLRRLAESPPAALEQVESLEQLRALSLGMRIHVGVLPHAPPPGVDTEADLAEAARVLAGQGNKGSAPGC